MIAANTVLGLHHYGRRISLARFEFAKVDERYTFELARGYIIAWETPPISHGMQVSHIRSHFGHYSIENTGAIFAAFAGSECKLLIPARESERHPDIAVYLTPPNGPRGHKVWRTWVPELVVEVVSESSRDRDYTEKRDEYWTLGVKEYWIVDAKLQQVLILRRGRMQWTEKTLGPADVCQTKLLPGFKLPCRAVFDAGGPESDD